jgi:hypothetical protein
MVSKTVMAGAAVIVIAIIAAGILAFYKAPAPQASNATGAAGTQAKTNSSLLFNDSQYAQYAYLISGNATLSAAGIAATADFNITHSKLQDGAAEYFLKARATGIVYNATVGPGSRLYFIDTNTADDYPTSDASTVDDGYAVVNASGYIVTEVYPLSGA